MATHLSLLLGLLLVCGLATVNAQLRVFNLRATGLPSGLLGTTDGYVKVFCGAATLGKTSVRNDNPNPWWKEEFTHFSAKENDVLKLEVFDSDVLLDDLLGTCQRPLKVGSHNFDCYLKKGGTLHYSYTLAGNSQ